MRPDKPNYLRDLHLHTSASDGGYSAREVVAQAAVRGMQAIAVTDHDSLASNAAALEACTGAGLKFVPGVELTSAERYHILGYFIQSGDSPLARYLGSLREKSWAFMCGVLELLGRTRGIQVEAAELACRTGAGIPNMSHLLDLLYLRGDLPEVRFDSPAAVELFGDPDYLVNYFREFARTRPFVDAAGAIRLIRSADGVPVWAHPQLASRAEAERLKASGLLGLELNTPKHNKAMRKHIRRLCDELDLLPTGGTDYHGRYFQSIENGRQIGTFGVSARMLERLEEKASQLRQPQ